MRLHWKRGNSRLAHGLGLSAARNSSAGSVFRTSSGPSQARRSCGQAVVHLAQIARVVRVGVDHDLAAHSLARRRSRSFRSRRSGAALCSTATPRSTAPAQHRPHVHCKRARGAAASGPSDGPECARRGFSMARSTRAVISSRLCSKRVCTLAMTNLHLREDFVLQIQSAVGQNVDFDAGKDADLPFHLAVGLAGCAECARAPASRPGRWSWPGSWSGR